MGYYKALPNRKKIYIKSEDEGNIIDWVKENWFIVLIGCIILYMLIKLIKEWMVHMRTPQVGMQDPWHDCVDIPPDYVDIIPTDYVDIVSTDWQA